MLRLHVILEPQLQACWMRALRQDTRPREGFREGFAHPARLGHPEAMDPAGYEPKSCLKRGCSDSCESGVGFTPTTWLQPIALSWSERLQSARLPTSVCKVSQVDARVIVTAGAQRRLYVQRSLSTK